MEELFAALKELYAGHDSDMAKRLPKLIESVEKSDPLLEPAWLDTCELLTNIHDTGDDPLLTLVLKQAEHLHWRRAVNGKLPPALSSSLAAVEFIGPTGIYRSDEGKIGFYLQAPNVYYPSHWHPAEELYYILHGTSGWAVDDKELVEKTRQSFVHHKSMQPHTMESWAEPVLAIWAWHGDISVDGYRISEHSSS